MTLHAGDRVVRGACPHDCPDTCAFIYDVKNGKLIDVTGDPDHPMTRGGLCVKLNGFAEHHYNPNRLLYPMRRTGPKGSGQYERISWDDALAEIKRRWTDITATYGSQAIMPHAYLGHQGTLNGLTAGDAFFNRLGSTVAEKTYCESGSSTAWIMTVGPSGGLDLESLAYAKYIIVWGMNMISTNLHAWPFILEAQKKGAKIVVIDPVRTRTAKQADWHVVIKPGTDGALALGMMNVIIAEGLVDYDYVEKYTLGFDELKARAANYPPERVAEITGIPVADIQTLAREYATTQPSAIRQGVAIERSRGGGQAIRAITCLPALVGAWRHVGGGTAEMPIWEFPTRFDRICRPDFIKPGTRVINELELGSALSGEMALDPPIKSLFVYNSNPVSQAPAQAKIVQGLQREDLFMVVSELFITDTARYADILLPATMQGEQYDLMVTWGHLYMMLNQPAISAPGECIPNVELFRRLAKTMGFDDAYWDMTDDEMLLEFYDWELAAAARHHARSAQGEGLHAPQCRGSGQARPACRGQLQDPLGQMRVQIERRRERQFRRAGLAVDVRGNAAGRADRSVAGLHPALQIARLQPGSREALSAQHRVAQAACVPEHAIRQRGTPARPAGRTEDPDPSDRRTAAQHRERHRGARLQRPRRVRRTGGVERRSHAGAGDGQCRLLAEPQSQRRVGKFDQFGQALHLRPGRIVFGQPGRGGGRGGLTRERGRR